LLLAAVLLVLAGCGKRDTNSGQASQPPSETATETPTTTPSPSQSPSPSPSPSEPVYHEEYHDDTNPVVTIEMDNGGIIKIELFPKVAPNTVNNFISLIQQGFYDGTIFHRVIPGFMIQGGDPEGTGMGGPGYAIKGEFSANGFENNLKHTRGVLSMARKSEPLDSAGSQFFIMVADAPHLDKLYASFGSVVEGMDTVDAIVEQQIDPNDPAGTRPLNPMAIKKMTVDTKGVTYDKPETIPIE